MKREFLEALGLEKEAVDKIMDENGADLEREKAKTTQAKADLADAREQLSQRDKDLEELRKSAGTAGEVQKKLDDLQAKYDEETQRLSAQLAERDYSDAVARAIAGKGLKFSSKSAQRAFEAALREKKLEIKDGELSGLDDFIKAQKEADPDAFAPEKPAPRIVAPTGGGGAPAEPTPANVAQAKEMGAVRAAAAKASADIMKNYL